LFIIIILRWAGHVAHMGRGEIHTGFWWQPEGKRPLSRPRLTWENNIKIVLQEIPGGRGGVLGHD